MTALGTIQDNPNFSITVTDDIEIDSIINSTASITTTGGKITIKQKADQGSNVTLYAKGTISIGQKVDNKSSLLAITNGDIHIGQKVDNGSRATLSAIGTITVGQKIDNHSFAVLSGTTIIIDQKVDNNSDVHLTASQYITVSQGVDNNSLVVWDCPVGVTCPISDHGRLLNIHDLEASALDRARERFKQLGELAVKRSTEERWRRQVE